MAALEHVVAPVAAMEHVVAPVVAQAFAGEVAELGVAATAMHEVAASRLLDPDLHDTDRHTTI